MNPSLRMLRLPALLVIGLSAGCFSDIPGLGALSGDAASSESSRCIASEDAERTADQVLQLVNLERSEGGLAPVVVNTSLDKLASDFACRMIEGGFFGHEDPETKHGPGERAVAEKYSFFAIGENLAAGQESPAEVMRVWMESPSHRAVILDPRWKEVGIAVRSGGAHAIYWVQEFGDPANY